MTKRSANTSSGQALVEVALVLPVFILLLFGLVDAGRAIYTWNALSQAAQEGARLAAVQAGWIGITGTNCTIPMPDITPAPTTPCPASLADLNSRVLLAVNRETAEFGPLTSSSVTLTCSPACSTGDTVTVKVGYTFTALTPVIGQVFNNLHMGASATMVVN
jgi:Flp pilus assembly protein TadG